MDARAAPRPRSAERYSDSFMLLSVAPSYVDYKHQATSKSSRMLGMKTCDEIRYENLERLVEEAGGLSRLIEKSNGKLNRPTLYQILERVTTAAGTPKNIGDDLARKIEEALKLERGWMDNQENAQLGQSNAVLMPKEVIELLTLYSQCNPAGRKLILSAAESAAESFNLSTSSDDQFKHG